MGTSGSVSSQGCLVSDLRLSEREANLLAAALLWYGATRPQQDDMIWMVETVGGKHPKASKNEIDELAYRFSKGVDDGNFETQ